MLYGNLIKLERLNKNMKQLTLAKGVCTSSYLSKIENNQIEPSNEILELLFNKLELEFEKSGIQDFEEILTLAINLYKKAILNRDPEEFILNFSELNRRSVLLKDQTLYITIQLMMFRVSLIMQESQKTLKLNFEEISHQFTDKQIFLYETCKGIMNYQTGFNKQALSNFNNALEMISSISLEEWEAADFYYMLGLVNFSNYKNFRAREHINKALFYFRENLFFARLIDCYVMNGLILKRGGEYKEGLESFNLALKVANNFSLNKFKGIILHNLGDLESNQKNYSLSKNYFVESLKYKEEFESKLITILNLVADNFKMGDLIEVLKWSNEALELIKVEKKNKLTVFFLHQFLVYKSLCEEKEDSIEYLIKAIAFFEKKNYVKEASEYSRFLGKELYSKKRYKLASYYYEKSIQLHYEINN